jgi:TatD DNase family protein
VIELFDTHAHIQGPEFAPDREDVISRALAVGVETIVVPAVDLETAEAAIALAERREGVYATAGYHPHEASRLTAEALVATERLLDHVKVVAVGETGLDFYRMHSPREAQIGAFDAMLDLAGRRTMPVVVHCRDAWDVLRTILEPWAHLVRASFDGRPLGVLHYFPGSIEEARLYHELGFLISIHTSVTHPNAQNLRDVAAALPLEALVVETDSPYGAPQSQRARRNEPAYVIEAAKQIAAVRNTTLEAVAEATTANARRLFAHQLDGRRDAALATSADRPEGPSLRTRAAEAAP